MVTLTYNSYKGRSIEEGQKVKVYRNLHNDMWSIQSAKKPYHVLGHAEEVVTLDAELIVNETGRQKVLAEQKKNVHAFVKGFITFEAGEVNVGTELITYNPYKYETFVNAQTEEPVFKGEVVHLDAEKKVRIR